MQQTRLFFTANRVISYIRSEKPTSIAIVTSKNIFHTNTWIFNLIKKCGVRMTIIFVKDGEYAKTFKECEYVLHEFSKFTLNKSSLIIAVGGGSIGDLAGFAASIYLRGIAFINIPTTLLAQVDSAHGGKNGINFFGYKNQIGTIKEADAIFIDSKFLRTLKRDQIIDGLGEIIKYGFIKDTSILDLLDRDLKNIGKIKAADSSNTREHRSRVLAIRTRALMFEGESATADTLLPIPIVELSGISRIIKKSIQCKYFYIHKDLHEKSIRKILNVGHTFGHSLELRYKISHGMSVIIGMMKEFEFSEKFGFSGKNLTHRLELILDTLGINIDMKKYVINMEAISYDKKVRGDIIDFPIVKSIGKSAIKKINLKFIKKYLHE